MDSKSQIRELTTSELETVAGGMMATLDFGIVSIELLFPGGPTADGPMSAATICGETGRCISKILGP